MRIPDNTGMGSIDLRAREEFGVPQAVLMENAGRSAFETLKKRYPDLDRLIVWAGTGNNGGDGLVLARHARLAGMKVDVLLVRTDGNPAFRSEIAILQKYGQATRLWDGDWTLPQATGDRTVIVDAIAGTGLKAPYKYPEILEALTLSAEESGAPVVSLDLPSGLCDGFRRSWPSVRADLVIFMELPKLCAFAPIARERWVDYDFASVGFPPELVESAPGTFVDSPAILPKFPRGVHKGKRGHVAVFGGSVGTTGAPRLCADAAARCGAGLVTYYADPEIYASASIAPAGVMVVPSSGEPDLSRFQSLAVGPGWGTGEDRPDLLDNLVGSGLPGVLDADGLNLAAEFPGRWRFSGRWVMTPHPGEFRRLSASLGGGGYEPEDSWNGLAEAARTLDAVIVLKGASTFVMTPDGDYAVMDGRVPELATAGSGDVLAGIIAALLARGMTPFEAATAGINLHREAGIRARDGLGYFRAEDLGAFLATCAWEADRRG